MITEILLPALLIIGVCVLLFLIFRQLLCWYWKINKQIKLMEENNSLLFLIADSLGGDVLKIKNELTDKEVKYLISKLDDQLANKKITKEEYDVKIYEIKRKSPDY